MHIIKLKDEKFAALSLEKYNRLTSEIDRRKIQNTPYRSRTQTVAVLQTTAGWRKAPALAQRVCTQGVASLRSIFLKNTRNTAGFRVVRAAGA
jgi:hypothetical protein